MLEYLKTDTLIDIKNQIEKIIEDRTEPEEFLYGPYSELTFDERKFLFKNQWNENIKRFQELLPTYIKYTNNYFSGISENGGQWNAEGLPHKEWMELIKRLQNFSIQLNI